MTEPSYGVGAKAIETPEVDSVLGKLARGEETDEQYHDHVDAMLLTNNSKDAEMVGSLICVARSLERRLREAEAALAKSESDRITLAQQLAGTYTDLDAARKEGLKLALDWKPNTPQLENAMTYAWEQGIKQLIRGPWQVDGPSTPQGGQPFTRSEPSSPADGPARVEPLAVSEIVADLLKRDWHRGTLLLDQEDKIALERLHAALPAVQSDAQLGQECEMLIALKTHFTGEPPYVGNKGVLLALRESLDELNRLRRGAK